MVLALLIREGHIGDPRLAGLADDEREIVRDLLRFDPGTDGYGPIPEDG